MRVPSRGGARIRKQSSWLGPFPKRSEHTCIEQRGIADLVAVAVFHLAVLARRERRHIERRVQSPEKVPVVEGRGCHEGHPAGTGAHLDDRDNHPGINVPRPLPRGWPLGAVAETQQYSAKL